MNDHNTQCWKFGAWFVLILLAVGSVGCSEASRDTQASRDDASQTPASQEETASGDTDWNETQVTASSYTLSEKETKKGHVGISAFGERLKPEMRAVAVSPDLLRQGLSFGTRIRIEGLPGVYTVRDKMNKRWKKKIDILFQKRSRALEWGRQKITIEWRPAAENEG